MTSFHLRRTTPEAFPLADAVGQSAFAHIRAVVDLDRDGWEEILVAAVNWDDRIGEPRPVTVWRGVGPDSWVEDTESFFDGPVPALIHPRKAVVADLNGDGWPDVYVADHGLDQDPFPGTSNVIMLSNGTGQMRAATLDAERIGFHHGASAGDVDGDGDVDLFVTDDARAPSYMLVNLGEGVFERNDDVIPKDLQQVGAYTTELIDVDNDGYLDVFMAGHEFDGTPTVVLWGDGSGDFSAAERTVIPPVDGFGTVVDVGAGDLDGNGLTDLVVDRTGSWPPPAFYDGYLLQVLMQTAARTFVDETADRLVEGDWPKMSGEWLEWLFVMDGDDDGDLDLVIDPLLRGLAWFNDGQGRFTESP